MYSSCILKDDDQQEYTSVLNMYVPILRYLKLTPPIVIPSIIAIYGIWYVPVTQWDKNDSDIILKHHKTRSMTYIVKCVAAHACT